MILYSVVETAKASGPVVHDYISRCLQHIAEQLNNLERLLPWNIVRS
ncbi:MAG: transposase domain-containing protein [Alteromonadaceae bacterium]